MPVTILHKAPTECKYTFDQLFLKCCSLTMKLKDAREAAESMHSQLEVARNELQEARGALEEVDRMLATEQTLRRELQLEVYGLRKRKYNDGDSDFRKKVKTTLAQTHPDRCNKTFTPTQVTQLLTSLLA